MGGGRQKVNAGSVIVVFELVTHRQDGDGGGVLDLEERNVAAVAERYHQLAQERALARLTIPNEAGQLKDAGSVGTQQTSSCLEAGVDRDPGGHRSHDLHLPVAGICHGFDLHQSELFQLGHVP